MKLSVLAQRSDASAATIKFWIREGLLPPAPLKNERTAVYGTPHVERVLLIRTLREVFEAPIPRIRELTQAIDEGSPVTMVLELCQSLAAAAALPPRVQHPTGQDGTPGQSALPVTGDESPPVDAATRRDPAAAGDAAAPGVAAPGDTAALASAVCEDAGWSQLPSIARGELEATLATVAALGVRFSRDDLAQYARALEPIAQADLASVGGGGTPDQIALRTLLGARAQVAMLVAMNQLAHTSAALAWGEGFPRPGAETGGADTDGSEADSSEAEGSEQRGSRPSR